MSWNTIARKQRVLHFHVQALANGMRRLATSSKDAIVRALGDGSPQDPVVHRDRLAKLHKMSQTRVAEDQ